MFLCLFLFLSASNEKIASAIQINPKATPLSKLNGSRKKKIAISSDIVGAIYWSIPIVVRFSRDTAAVKKSRGKTVTRPPKHRKTSVVWSIPKRRSLCVPDQMINASAKGSANKVSTASPAIGSIERVFLINP